MRRRRYSVDVRTCQWDGQCNPPSRSKWKTHEAKDETFCTTYRQNWGIPSASIQPEEQSLEATEFLDAQQYGILSRGFKDMYSPPQNDETYVDLKHSELYNHQFHDLMKTADDDGWFYDNTVPASFEILKLITKAEDYRVAVLSP